MGLNVLNCQDQMVAKKDYVLNLLLTYWDSWSYNFDTMDPNTIFEKLRLLYGNHSKVARMLKIDPRVYRRWRAANRIPRITKLYLETLIIDTNRPREDVSDFS